MTADGDRSFFPRDAVEDGLIARARSAMDAPEHGGDRTAAEARHGVPGEGWLDLSTGINPKPYPCGRLARADLAALPQHDAEARLRDAAGTYFGVPPGAELVVAAGSQALIQWLPRLVSPARSVAILVPTYGEHARAWTLAGHAVRQIERLDEADAADIVVLCNPNNPDGRIEAPARLALLAERRAARGGLLVVDEAFADPTPTLSLIGHCGSTGLVVLRSFGKFFGLAGLRLGFAVAEGELARRLAAAIGPWPVSGPALAVATRAYRDEDWIAAARRRLAQDSDRLDRLLTRHGLARIGGTDLFALYRHDAAAILAEHLGRAGILVRCFTAQQDWLRFGLPGSASGWRRLTAALAQWQFE